MKLIIILKKNKYINYNLFSQKNLFIKKMSSKMPSDGIKPTSFHSIQERTLMGDMSAFDEWASQYDQDAADWGYHAPDIASSRLVRALRSTNGKNKIKVLDVGCGTGLTTEALLKVTPENCEFEVWGADVSQAMLQIGQDKKIYKGIEKIDLNIDSLNGKFDGIISTGVFTEGQLKLDVLLKLVEENLLENGVMSISIRSSYWDKNFIEKLNSQGCDVTTEEFVYLDRNTVMATLLVIKKREDSLSHFTK